MNWTDYAGLAGLVAAAVLAGWTLLGNPITPHRGTPRHSGSSPHGRPTPGRHRAPAQRLLVRLRLR